MFKRETFPGSLPGAPAQAHAASDLATMLAAARAIAQRDGCAAALGRYQSIVSRGGNAPEAGEALLEVARCQTSLGQAAAARTSLERAAQNPAVAARARNMLSTSQAPAAAAPAGKTAVSDTDRKQ